MVRIYNEISRAIKIVDVDKLELSNVHSLDGKLSWILFWVCLNDLIFSFGMCLRQVKDMCENLICSDCMVDQPVYVTDLLRNFYTRRGLLDKWYTAI